MRRSRITPASVRLASVVALVALLVLGSLTVGWAVASSDDPRGGGREAAGSGGAVPDGRSLLNADGTVGPVVALGDSLTADTREAAAADGRSYESWYVRALEDEPRLVSAYNAGIAGSTTPDMLARYARDVAAYGPRVVVILGGTNDLGAGWTTEQVLATLEQLVGRARDGGAAPVLATIPPRTDGAYAARVEDLNAAIRAFGEASGIPVIDFYEVLADDAGGWRTGFTDDGVHPTAAAADAMVETALETLLLE